MIEGTMKSEEMRTVELVTIAAAAERFGITLDEVERFIEEKGIRVWSGGPFRCVNVAELPDIGAERKNLDRLYDEFERRLLENHDERRNS